MCRSAHPVNGELAGGARGKPGHIQRVVLWAPPRSLSTAVERALIEHPEIEVQHEPFGVPHYWSAEAASTRESTQARRAPTFDSVAKTVFRADPTAGKNYVFSKNLSYYFARAC